VAATSAFLFVFLVAGGVERLGALGVVTIDGDSLEATLPGLDVSIHDVFDRGSSGMLMVLLMAPERKGWAAAHHLDVPTQGDGTPAGGGQGAIEDGDVFGLDERRAIHFAVGVDCS